MPNTIGDRRPRPWPRRGAGEWSGPVWCCCVAFCTLTAVLVLLAAIAVLAIHFGVHPVPPHLAVRSAGLDALRYDRHQGGLQLQGIQLSVNAAVENNNAKLDFSFSKLMFNLTFDGTVIVSLAADPFDVPRKAAQLLNYTARASYIGPLDGAMEDALSRGLVPFRLAGRARAHWKVGKVVAFKTWAHLACDMAFYWPPRTTGTTAYTDCTSTSKL